jgi:hypothetical protein
MGAFTPGAASGAAIERALREVARLLEARDAAAAAAAIESLNAACAAASVAGIDDVTRTRLQPLVERCLGLTAQTNAGLAASLAKLGAGNRAHRAYNAD